MWWAALAQMIDSKRKENQAAAAQAAQNPAIAGALEGNPQPAMLPSAPIRPQGNMAGLGGGGGGSPMGGQEAAGGGGMSGDAANAFRNSFGLGGLGGGGALSGSQGQGLSLGLPMNDPNAPWLRQPIYGG